MARIRFAVNSSAGKNVSSASSDSVMSTGVPKIMVADIKLKVSPSKRSLKGIATLSAGSGADRAGIGGRLAWAMQPLQQMPAPFGDVDRARRQRLRVKCQSQDIEGLTQQPLG